MNPTASQLKTILPQYFVAAVSAVSSKMPPLMILLGGFFTLDSENFGKFTILVLLANLVSVLASCGGDLWLNRFTRFEKHENKKAPFVSKDYVNISLAIASSIGAIAILIQFFSLNLLNTPSSIIFLTLCYGIFTGLTETFSAILRASNRVNLFFLIRDFLSSTLLILGLLLLDLKTVYDFLLMTNALYLILLFSLIGVTFSRPRVYFPSRTGQRISYGPLISHTAKLISNNLLSRIVNSFDVLLLAFLIPIATVGQYRLCAAVANGLIILQHYVFLSLPWQMQHASAYLSDGQSQQDIKSRQSLLVFSSLIGILSLLVVVNFFSNVLPLKFDLNQFRNMFMALVLIRYSEMLWGPQHEVLVSNNKITQEILIHLTVLVLGIGLFISLAFFVNGIQAALISAGVTSFVLQHLRRIIIQALQINTPLPQNWIWSFGLTFGALLLTYLYL